MKIYLVTIPIAGTVSTEVEAENEKEAIEKAMEADLRDEELQWETYRKFNSGNLCHIDSPWEVGAEQISDEEDEP